MRTPSSETVALVLGMLAWLLLLWGAAWLALS